MAYQNNVDVADTTVSINLSFIVGLIIDYLIAALPTLGH